MDIHSGFIDSVVMDSRCLCGNTARTGMFRGVLQLPYVAILLLCGCFGGCTLQDSCLRTIVLQTGTKQPAVTACAASDRGVYCGGRAPPERGGGDPGEDLPGRGQYQPLRIRLERASRCRRTGRHQSRNGRRHPESSLPAVSFLLSCRLQPKRRRIDCYRRSGIRAPVRDTEPARGRFPRHRPGYRSSCR